MMEWSINDELEKTGKKAEVIQSMQQSKHMSVWAKKSTRSFGH
jgi:hypothetical protein